VAANSQVIRRCLLALAVKIDRLSLGASNTNLLVWMLAIRRMIYADHKILKALSRANPLEIFIPIIPPHKKMNISAAGAAQPLALCVYSSKSSERVAE